MMKYLPLILFLLVLALPAVVSRFIDREKVPVVPANALLLDIVTPHNQDIRNEFAAAFSKWHAEKYGAPVSVRFNAPGGTGDIQRLLDATYREALTKEGTVPASFTPPFDMAWGGGDRFFDREINKYLMPIDLPPEVLQAAFPNVRLAGVRLYDLKPAKDGKPAPIKWVGACISSFGIVYNPDVYKHLNLPAPKTWSDLARPELAGWLALANPLSSSSAAVSYSMAYQRTMADEEEAILKTRPDLVPKTTAERMKDPEYKAAIARGWKKGMGHLMLIAANARYVTDSGSQPPNDVANGDAAAGMAIDFYGRANEASVGADRCKLVIPVRATAINPDPIGILLGTKPDRYITANRFIEFLLTPEAQRLWISKPATPTGPKTRAMFRTPIRADVYTTSDTSLWTHPDLNPFTDVTGFDQRPEWGTLFSEIRLLWAASWIDAREELRDAYLAVLAVKDPSKREALLAQLADIPMSYGDVEKLQAQLREVLEKDRANSDKFRAEKRIEIANLFRDHFNKVRSLAR